MHENLNPLNNILVLYPMKRPFVFSQAAQT